MYYPSYRQTAASQQNLLTVVGEGEIVALPDLIEITLGIRTEEESAKEAIEVNARIANQIIENLVTIGIAQERIETKSYNVRPIYDFIEGRSVLRGYEVEHLFEVTITDINQVGEVLSSSADAGANIVHGLQFKISDPNELYLQALGNAVDSGLQKGLQLAEQMGVTLVQPPIRITELRDQPVSVFQPEATVLSTAVPAMPSILAQNVLIQAKVVMVYSYS